MGLNGELFDEKFPTFRVHKKDLEEMTNMYQDRTRLWYKMRRKEDPTRHIPDHRYRTMQTNGEEKKPGCNAECLMRLETENFKEEVNLEEVDK